MARELPDTIAVVLPEDWQEFPVDPDGFRQYRKRLVGDLNQAEGLTKTERRQAELFLSELVSFARDQRVTFASAYLAERDETEDGAVLAGLVVSTILRSDISGDVPLLPDVLVAAYADRLPEAGDRVTLTNLESPRQVTLGDHAAVRLQRLLRLNEVADHKSGGQYVETFLIPVSEGDALVNLTFSTVNIDLASDLSRLFNGIAETLRILFPGDPTLINAG